MSADDIAGMFTDELTCTERFRQLKKEMISEPRYMSAEQALLVAESYWQHADEPWILQRAKVFAHVAKHIRIKIDPAEIIERTEYGAQEFKSMPG